MGGALIIIVIFVTTLLWGELNNRYVWTALLVTMAFGGVGWVDDYLKLTRNNARGLTAGWKYTWQSVFGAAAAIFLYWSAELPAETHLIVPFFKAVAVPLGLGYVVVAYFVIVGMSNAVNLTDGLDGLAILPTVMVSAALALIAYLAGHIEFAHYLQIPYIPLAGEMAVFCGAIIGAGLGFLWFNTYPARSSWAMWAPWRLARRWPWWPSSCVTRSCCSSWAGCSCWKRYRSSCRWRPIA